MTNRKLHTRFRLVPKSTTLNDLERPLRILFQNTCVFGAHHENSYMKTDSHCQQHGSSPVTLVSGNIRSMLIFAGVPWRLVFKRQWGNRNVNFQSFRTLYLRKLRKSGQHYYTVLLSLSSPLTSKYVTLELPWSLYFKFCFCTGTTRIFAWISINTCVKLIQIDP